MDEEECNRIISRMETDGWTCDVNDEKRLGFIMPVNEEIEWIRDYDKSSRTFMQFNGKQKVNLVNFYKELEHQAKASNELHN